jgi:hypothetical protein
MYIINCKSQDISYSISKLSRFTSNSSMDNWKAISKKIFEIHLSL